MNQPVFRPALPEDIPATLQMMQAFYAIDGYPFNEPATERNLQEFLRNQHLGRLWMVESGQVLAGYFILTFGYSFEFRGRIALLDEVYLDKEFRNQGVGKMIVEFILEKAQDFGLQTILLEVEKHNAAALHLYEKLGFRDHHRLIMSRAVNKS